MHSKLIFIGGFALVTAAKHDILVGNNNTDLTGLRFTPNTTTAAVGDTLVFHFYPGNHNVAQGSFSSPCQPLAGGFYSGFINSQQGEAGEIFTLTINDTNPIWVYCSEVQHCQLGMAAVINPPSSGETLEAYIDIAANTTGSGTPDVVAGGIISSDQSASPSALPSSSAGVSTNTVSMASSTTAISSGTYTASPAHSSNPASSLGNGKGIVPSAIGAVLALAIACAGFI